MRFIVLIALVAVASATYTNRHRFNRLLRSYQQDQDEGYYGQQQGRQYNQLYDNEDQDQDYEDEYEQECQRRGQCPRYPSNGMDDDETEYGMNNDQYEEQDYEQNQYPFQYKKHQRQGRRHQYRQYPQQQQYGQQYGNQQQCQPRFQLLQALEQPNIHLASKLYKQAKLECDDKNTVVSPAALQLALAAIQRGARGNTKRQIQRITSAGLTKQQHRQAHAALQQVLHQGQQEPMMQQYGQGQNQKSKVKTTTTIVINQRNRAQQHFIQTVKSCLNVQVKKCNFQHQPQQCRQHINQIVAQKTQHKLKQIVPQDAVTTNTKMIVVNTAQVKAPWGRQFRQHQQTKQGRFFPLGCQQPKHVQVLKSQGQFNYYEDEQLQVVGVPTQQQELTMFVIVPKTKDGLNQVEKSQIQDGEQLKQLLEQTEQQREHVQIELPKFQIKHKIDAKQTLRKEGVQAVFDADEADLSGINGQQPKPQFEQNRRRHQPYGQQFEDEEQYEQEYYGGEQQGRGQQLHLNKLIHQCTIKIDEQGISAARPGNQGQQYEQQQYQKHQGQYEPEQQYGDEDEYETEYYNTDDYEQEQSYRKNQFERQELFEDVFGQRQQQRRGGRHNRRQPRGMYQQDEDETTGYGQQYGQEQYGQEYGRYGQHGEQKMVKVNRAFAFAIKHNPSNQIVLVGRVVDAAQKPKSHHQQGLRQQGQSLNGVDQQ